MIDTWCFSLQPSENLSILSPKNLTRCSRGRAKRVAGPQFVEPNSAAYSPCSNRAQTDAAIASHQAQLQAQKAQNEAIHLQVKTQSEIALAKVRPISTPGSHCSMRI
jgi:hypothetical protein